MTQTKLTKPFTLIILDGWGENTDSLYNPIKQTRTPTFDRLLKNYPHTLLMASGKAVGLPEGQMGNSKVGHLHLGSGRRLPQELVRVTEDIEAGVFQKNPIFIEAINLAKHNHKAIHILGLLSPGGIHSHEQHLQAAIRLCHQYAVEKIYVHPILDGRDTPPKSAMHSIKALQAICQANNSRILSIIGRYYAMDRDHRWERTQQAYDLIVRAQANYIAETAESGLAMAYERGETDEFVKATRIAMPNEDPVMMEDGDIVFFMNFRADRARQICQALTQEHDIPFTRPHLPQIAELVTLTCYSADLPAKVVYPPMEIKNTLGECIAKAGLKQLRIAETEKYAHVTYFFNGGNETPNLNEERILIPSPKVATYDLQPEMSAIELTEKLVEAIESKQFDIIICNYANPDMVGHTGDMKAANIAVAVIDQCIAKILIATDKAEGEILITADHGNIEQMYDAVEQQPHTAHTTNLVPLIYYGKKTLKFKEGGSLADVAPTMLSLLGLPVPAEMDGRIIVM